MKVKQHVFLLLTLLTMGGLIGTTNAVAREKEKIPDPFREAYRQAMAKQAQELDYIAANRMTVQFDLANRCTAEWGNEPVDNILQTFATLTDRDLLAASSAMTCDRVRAVLMGRSPDAEALGFEVPLAVGDGDRDLLYTPVDPCRIIDTRFAGGVIAANTERSFDVWGSVVGQGGNPGGCPSPRGEPRGVHLNVTAVPQSAQGNLQVFPTGTVPGTGSLVNYKLGTNIANAATVRTGFAIGDDIIIRSNFGDAHVIADVLGYYHEVNVDEIKPLSALSVTDATTELTVAGGCTNYDGGTVTINVPGPGQIYVIAEVQLLLESHTLGTADDIEIHLGDTATDCTPIQDSAEGYSFMNWIIDAAEPGWTATYLGHIENISISRMVTVGEAGSHTFYLNAIRFSGAGPGGFWYASMKAIYYPEI